MKWRLASSFPKSLDTLFGAADLFSRKVGEMTGGKFQISVHAAGELMPAFGVVDGVQNNTVEMAHTAPYYFYGKDPTFALGCAIPFGLNARQMTSWMLEGNGLKLMREFYRNYNIINFLGGNTGAQMGRLVPQGDQVGGRHQGPEDARRRPGRAHLRAHGRRAAEPARRGDLLGAGEGHDRCAEFVGPYDDQKLGFNKVAPNYYYPAWWEGGPQVDFYINTKAYEGLSAEYKTIVEAAASLAHNDILAKYDARNPIALKQLVGSGTKLFRFPKDVMDASFKEAQAVYSELSAGNPAWKKFYEDFAIFPPRREPVVPLRRGGLRRLHAVAEALNRA